jgi:hypothetical protein
VGEYDTIFHLAIAYGIMWRLGEFLLLVVAVWGLNTVLRQRLAGRHQTLFKIICGVVLGLVGIFGATSIAVASYNTWTRTSAADYDDRSLSEGTYLGLTYRVLYLVASFIGGALALFSLFRLRSQVPVKVSVPLLFGLVHNSNKLYQGLIVWVLILTFSMAIFSVIIISLTASAMQNIELELNTYLATEFVIQFFIHVSFITLLCIAKSAAFKQPIGMEQPPTYSQPAYAQPQYAPVQQQYGANPPQPYYNQQQPAQLPNNQPLYYGQPQLDGTQRYEVKA